MFANPFVVYILSFGGVIAVYQLGWSDAYPDMSPALLSFFAVTFTVSVLLGWLVTGELQRAPEYKAGRMPLFVVWPLIASFAADLIYTGYVPLFSSLGGDFLFSGEIGLPSVHVFNVTFGAAFSAIRFCDFLYSRRWRYLAEAAVPIVYFLMILYRGPIIMLLIAWFFVWIVQGGLNLKRSLAIGALACTVLFAFGKLGDLREGGSEAIVNLGRPSTTFKDSGIPSAYLWAYIYMTSPFANLQLAADSKSLDNLSSTEFLISEMVPDVIFKRIVPFLKRGHLLSEEKVRPPEVAPGLNVASIYGRAMVLNQWTGAIIMFAQLCALIAVYLRLIRNSPFRVPCLALLNCLVVFCTFQNMIAFSGVVLQLAWPLIFAVVLGAISPVGRLPSRLDGPFGDDLPHPSGHLR
jgi:hypothetical protein